jgi:hypothetical protein
LSNHFIGNILNMSHTKTEDLGLAKRWAAGAIAASTAEFFSLPFDTVLFF